MIRSVKPIVYGQLTHLQTLFNGKTGRMLPDGTYLHFGPAPIFLVGPENVQEVCLYDRQKLRSVEEYEEHFFL
jgi:hypothetical protein